MNIEFQNDGGAHKNVSPVLQHSQYAQQKLEGVFHSFPARSNVLSVSAAAYRAHLAMDRIRSAVKNVIPQIKVSFLVKL